MARDRLPQGDWTRGTMTDFAPFSSSNFVVAPVISRFKGPVLIAREPLALTHSAQEKRVSFAQPRGLAKGYFCPHLVHQTACSLRRLGPSRALRKLAPHRHLPTGVEHFWQNRTFVASKHLRCTSVPLTLIQKVGPEYITPPTWNHGAPPGPRPAPRATVWGPTLRLSRSSSSAPCRSCRTWPASRVRRTA